MKYWRGYLLAAILGLGTWAIVEFAAAHTTLADMVYPYASRMIQDFLAEWTGGVDFLLWQVLAIALVVLGLSSVVLMIIFRWNFIQWLGWVLASVTFIWCLHTGLYGLNQHCSPLSQDIRLTIEADITTTDLINATTYFRDKANELAVSVPRHPDGSLNAPSFRETAEAAADGFENLVYEQNLAVFAGSTIPVKELGWAEMYTSMGIAGVTMPLTGEAAVNPNTPAVSLPFTICHEMAHRMCIAQERDANLAAYLACISNEDPLYQYAGYFMAFRYCYNALTSLSTSTATNAANALYTGMNEQLTGDMDAYREHYLETVDPSASDFADSVNDSYLQASGDESGIKSYGEVADLLISWYLQEIYLPLHADDEVENGFDPMDPEDVFVTEPQG